MCTWATCTWRVHGVCTHAFVLRVCWICGVCMSRQTAGGCWASTEHAFGVPIKAPHFVASAISGQTISGLQPPKRPSRDSLGSCVVVVCVSTVLGHCCRRATVQPPGGPKQQGQEVTCRRVAMGTLSGLESAGPGHLGRPLSPESRGRPKVAVSVGAVLAPCEGPSWAMFVIIRIFPFVIRDKY